MNRYLLVATPEELKLPEALKYMQICKTIVTGPGPINVISALRFIPKDSFVYNVGYAGSPDLKPGTKVGITSVQAWHPNIDFYEPRLLITPPGGKKAHCITMQDFCTDPSNLPPGCVVDMELAYIAAYFSEFGAVGAIKYVSDNLNKKEYEQCLRK